jgi:hypothetical protein
MGAVQSFQKKSTPNRAWISNGLRGLGASPRSQFGLFVSKGQTDKPNISATLGFDQNGGAATILDGAHSSLEI